MFFGHLNLSYTSSVVQEKNHPIQGVVVMGNRDFDGLDNNSR
jgi:hypothetical protein